MKAETRLNKILKMDDSNLKRLKLISFCLIHCVPNSPIQNKAMAEQDRLWELGYTSNNSAKQNLKNRTGDKKMNKKPEIEIKTEWAHDTYPDISYLGEFTSTKPNTAYIDRKMSTLVNPNKTIDKVFNTEQELNQYIEKIENFDISFDSWENENNTFECNHDDFAELPFDCNYGRNDYRYIKSTNYENPEQEEYQYIISDTKELEKICDGKIWFEGCKVSLFVDNVEIASSSLWGIPSNDTDEYRKEIEVDLTAEVKQEAKETLKTLKKVKL